ncbi:MAG TPA: 16S rRNA (adenine(1518)-N(6)/adenine(1519)-N(6))-dimethyltransferase RsmA [Steroidobacteraceae bacterium]|jgi:16S rRNA (adenine1518-N6/adenine1519-N6)-dimethyltransferase
MHRARKRFGQHFLHDQRVIGGIVDSIDPQHGDRVVEIGPGLGAITLPLLQRLEHLDAVEIDRDAIRHLRNATAGNDALAIHEADVLDFDFGSLRGDGPPLRIVGNLPYNISTPLLFRLIRQREHIQDMHFMLQKEVVDRMAAAAGDDHYGRLTVMLAPWLQVAPLFDIDAGAFRPPPRVTSTFVRLTPHATAPFQTPQRFAAVVGAAFSQRRKTLRNSLKSLLSEEQIRAAGIDPSARAEVIPPAGFAQLAALVAPEVVVPPPADVIDEFTDASAGDGDF